MGNDQNGSHSKPRGARRTSRTAHVVDSQRTCRRQPDVSPGRRLAQRPDSGGGPCNVRTVGESAAAFSSSTRGSTRASIGRSLRYEGRIAAVRGLEWITNGGSLLKHAPLMPPHRRRSYPYASIPATSSSRIYARDVYVLVRRPAGLRTAEGLAARCDG